MNNYPKVMGRWLYHPYKCHVCKQQMAFKEGMRVDKEHNVMIHTRCETK